MFLNCITGTIMLGGASTPEYDQLTCHGNNSMFVLIGNPGMVWHPLTNQCILAQETCEKIGGFKYDEPGEIFYYFVMCS